jgi:hypothetical protein
MYILLYTVLCTGFGFVLALERSRKRKAEEMNATDEKELRSTSTFIAKPMPNFSEIAVVYLTCHAN